MNANLRSAIQQRIAAAIKTAQDSRILRTLAINLPDGTKVAVLPNLHIPAHHAPLLDQVLLCLAALQPHILVLTGETLELFTRWRYGLSERGVKETASSTWELMARIVRKSGVVHAFFVPGLPADAISFFISNVTADLPATVICPDSLEEQDFDAGALLLEETFFRRTVDPMLWLAHNSMGSMVYTGSHMMIQISVREEVMAYKLGHLAHPAHPLLACPRDVERGFSGFAIGHVFNGRMFLQPVPVRQISSRKIGFLWDEDFYSCPAANAV